MTEQLDKTTAAKDLSETAGTENKDTETEGACCALKNEKPESAHDGQKSRAPKHLSREQKKPERHERHAEHQSEKPVRKPRGPQFEYVVYVQFEGSKKAYSFGTDEIFKTGDQVVVETVRGQEIGTIYVPSLPFDPLKVRGEIKPVIRKATEADLTRRAANLTRAKICFKICQESISRLNLDMHLISCELTLDRSKVIFTYVSDDRVDFRELLKSLSSQMQGRIELRQVGPRNKAKMVGGIGSCGMECCCSRFMSDFDTVSINMAKNQMLALNISKLSGQCGKLKCCLRFENEQYSELRQGLPKINSQITYNGNTYRITSMNLLQKQAKLENKEEVLFLSFEELWPAEKCDEQTEQL